MLAWLCVLGLGLAVVWLARERIRVREARDAAMERVTRLEREGLARDAIFDAIVQQSPNATMLLDGFGKVRFVNLAARALFLRGREPSEELSIADVLGTIPDPLKRALGGDVSELVSFERDDEPEVMLVGKRAFSSADTGTLTIVTAQPITSALMREELASYKRLLRVLSHELNNSLAPVASLASTGGRLAAGQDYAEIPALLATISERVEHLRTFLQRYSAIARLPSPRRTDVELGPIFERLRRLFPGISAPEVAGKGYLDEAQLEQVLVNLVKNALEAESDAADVEVLASVGEDGVRLRVRDRGHGLNDEVLGSALVPFFSTKADGTGLGLSVAREIVEAHGGRLRLRGREDGGAEVLVRLPNRDRGGSSDLSLLGTR